MAAGGDVAVGERTLNVTNLSKVFYPKSGFTKGDVLEYYIGAAPALLPHLKDRPLTLKRYPDGVDGEFFYQKEAPAHRPKWLATAPAWSEVRGKTINYCLANDLESLVWLVNIGDLELHAFLHRAKTQTRPDWIVFDLDPGPGAGLVECGRVGLLLREELGAMGLKTWIKTSGGKGAQLYVPLNTDVTYETTKPFSRAIAERLERANPKLVTSNMRKDLRAGKVFIDWSQNDEHKTTVCVYSLRARPEPTVSTPLQWGEVERAVADKDPDRLVFKAADVRARIEAKGDLFKPLLRTQQALPSLKS
jgi:bifunctional non-homologous end joining protein LigD